MSTPLRPERLAVLIKRHTKSMSMLITKLTCTENSAMGPKDVVLIS